MGENLFLGCTTMVVCLVVQCLVVGILFELIMAMEQRGTIRTGIFGVSYLLILVLLIMMAANLVQMALWGGLFYFLGEFKSFGTAFYHSVVNFTTLGYGDLVMSEGRRLLGALEAANGVLMFALTASLLFTVLNDLVNREWDRRMNPSHRHSKSD